MAVCQFLPSRVWLCGLAVVVSCTALGVAGLKRYAAERRGTRAAALGVVQNEAPDGLPRAGGLDPKQRELIWDIEHHGNLLNRHGFKALAAALSRADAAALVQLLAPSFAGQVPREPREVRLAAGFASAVRRQDQGRGYEPLTGEQFVAQLLDFRRPFSQPPKVQVSLMALAPEQREDFAGPWRGTCLLRMAGEAGPGQPAEVLFQLAYQIPCPSEETLRAGGWLRQCTILQSQEAHAPHFLLKDVTAQRGLDAKQFLDNWLAPPDQRQPNTGGAYLCDYDRDGCLDLLVIDVTRYVLYQGLPDGTFRDVTAAVGLPQQPVSVALGVFAAVLDVDGDGWEDVLVGGKVYRNLEGHRFIDYTERTNLRFQPGRVVTGVALADYDRDGRVDLYVCYGGRPRGSSWMDGASADAAGNELWRNRGGWQFEDVTAASGTAGGRRSTFSAVWFDANDDGWPDLHVANEFGAGILLVNQGDGTFREHLLGDGPNDFGSMGVTCGDIDNDGHIDLYVANMYSKAGTRIIGNLEPGTYPPDVMARLRQFVAGSQLWRNKGPPLAASPRCFSRTRASVASSSRARPGSESDTDSSPGAGSVSSTWQPMLPSGATFTGCGTHVAPSAPFNVSTIDATAGRYPYSGSPSDVGVTWIGQSDETTACLPSFRASKSSRIVGYAFARSCRVGFAGSQSGERWLAVMRLASDVQSHATLFALALQSRGVASAKVHAYCRSEPPNHGRFELNSRPWIGSASSALEGPESPGRGVADSIMCGSIPDVSKCSGSFPRTLTQSASVSWLFFGLDGSKCKSSCGTPPMCA
jgi:hypothetical protein